MDWNAFLDEDWYFLCDDIWDVSFLEAWSWDVVIVVKRLFNHYWAFLGAAWCTTGSAGA